MGRMGGPARRTWVPSAIVAAAGVLGLALQQLATAPPESPVGWILFVAGTLILLAAAVTPALFRWLRDAALVAWERMREHARFRTLIALALVTAMGLLVGVVSPAAAVQVRRWLNGCETATEVRVLTSTEQLDSSAQLGDAYERWTADHNGGCPTANLYVYAGSPQSVAGAVASGWPDETLRGIGPRPDLWLAESSLQVDRAIQQAPQHDVVLPIARYRSIATSPVLVGVPVERTTEELRQTRGSLVWGRLWTELERLRVDVVRPDPATTVVGELATAALYASFDARAAPVPEQIRARQIEQRIAASLDRGGYPIGTTADLLCRQIAPDSPRSAVILTEQALVRYNQGLAPAGGCGVAREPARAEECLYALYPPDTLSVHHPLVRLTWDGPNTPAARAAARFDEWLDSAAGKRALLGIGLRPSGSFGDPLTPRFCVQTSPAYPRQEPDPAALEQALRRYDEVRRPGRVLLAVDASGSMLERVGDAGTRFEVAGAGVQRSLDLLGARDEFGLWVFPGSAGGAGVRQLVPIGRGDAPHGGMPRRAAAVDALRRVKPVGATPLYTTVAAGVDAVATGSKDHVTSLVVLTDGQDTVGGIAPQALDQRVRDKGVRIFVIAVGEARCAQTLTEITGHTGGSCRQARFDTVDDVLVELLGSLWGGDAGRDS